MPGERRTKKKENKLFQLLSIARYSSPHDTNVAVFHPYNNLVK